jgi:hypothetical protein
MQYPQQQQPPVYTQPAPSFFQQTPQQVQPQQALSNAFQPPFVQANITLELPKVFDCESDPEELEDENSSLSQVCDQESETQPDSTYEKWGVDHHAPEQTYKYSKEELDIFLQCITSVEKSEQSWHSLESSKHSRADSKTTYPLKNQAVHMQQSHSDTGVSIKLGLPSPQSDIKEISCASQKCNVMTTRCTTPSPFEQESEYAGVMTTLVSPPVKLCTEVIEGKSRCGKVMPLSNPEDTIPMLTASQDTGAGHDDACDLCHLMPESTGEMVIPAVPPVKLCIETKGEVERDRKVLLVSQLKDTTELLADLSITVAEPADSDHKLHEEMAESTREMAVMATSLVSMLCLTITERMSSYSAVQFVPRTAETSDRALAILRCLLVKLYSTHLKTSPYIWLCMHLQKQLYCLIHSYILYHKGLYAENKCWTIPWCAGLSQTMTH